MIVIARDEEKMIGECLASVRWADERIVVVDSRTRDRTALLAQELKARVYRRRFRSFGAQKQYALDKARYDWVLVLDADERVGPELRREIITKIQLNNCHGYYAYFHEFLLGKDLVPYGKGGQGCIRLFQKNRARFLQSRIHEKVIIEGRTGRLNNRIIHHSHRTIRQVLDKFNRYSRLEAEELWNAGGRTNWGYIFLAPANAALKHFFVYNYWHYGGYGAIRAFLAGMYYLMKHLHLWEIQHQK